MERPNPEELTIPEWAPTISSRPEVSQYLSNLQLDYEDMAYLVTARGVPRDQLRGLHIHYTHLPLWDDQWAGRFLDPRQAFHHRRFIRESIPDLSTREIRSKSFVFVNVPATISEQPLNASNLLRSVTIHELEHFAEYELRHQALFESALIHRGLQAAFIVELSAIIATARLEMDDAFYPLIGALGFTTLAAFINQDRASNVLASQEDEEQRVVQKTHDSMMSRQYENLLSAQLRQQGLG